MKEFSSRKRSKSSKLGSLGAILLGSLVLTDSAYAYLDPGTGSMIVQIILGGVAGLAVAGKLFWSQITEFFRNLFGRSGAQGKFPAPSTEEVDSDVGQITEQEKSS